MALIDFKILPGIDKQNTTKGAENRWIDSDNVRFRYGLPEKVGGWASLVNDSIVDFGYQCKSCVYCQASVSLLSKTSINSSPKNVKKLLKLAETFSENKNILFPKHWLVFKKIFNKNNIARKECLLLPFKTLSKALKS